MGKLRVYTTTENGTTLDYEAVLPAFADVDIASGEDALIEGATTNAAQVGEPQSNPDDVSVVVKHLFGEELEEAQAKNEKEQEAASKKAAKEAEKEAEKAEG